MALASGVEDYEEARRAPLLSSQGGPYEEQGESLEDWSHLFWLSPAELGRFPLEVPNQDQGIERLVSSVTYPSTAPAQSAN